MIIDYLISNSDIYGLSDLANTLFVYELLDSITLDGEDKIDEEFIEFYIDEDYLKIFVANISLKNITIS